MNKCSSFDRINLKHEAYKKGVHLVVERYPSTTLFSVANNNL